MDDLEPSPWDDVLAPDPAAPLRVSTTLADLALDDSQGFADDSQGFADDFGGFNEPEPEDYEARSRRQLSQLTAGAEDLHEEPEATPQSGEALFGELLPAVKNAPALAVTSPLRKQVLVGRRARKHLPKEVVQHLKEDPLSVIEPAKPSSSTEDEIPKEKPAEPEQASNGTKRPKDSDLDIAVGDPVKVGDITNAHIVYQIKTRSRNPSNPIQEASVPRRYKDFRWVYHQLQNNHPGRIIPPPPTKQTYIGRFNESFIENRRLLLEKMLTKISRIPVLAADPDFAMFLTSDNFAAESKEREQATGLGASSGTNGILDNEDGPVASGTPSGFISSLFSISTKIPEPDEFFSKKKAYFDDLEHNLKTFYKSLELIAGQRVEIVGVVEEIAVTVEALASLEVLKATSALLSAFAEVHSKLKENLDRVTLQDQLTLGFTIEEYLRIIGLVKYVFETRLGIYQQFKTFELDMLKKQEAVDRAAKRASADKIGNLNFELDKLKQKTSGYEKSFATISDTIKEELETFEMEKIDDFRNSVEIFIESLIEAQKEAIELWETFYERQNLALA